MTARFHNPVDTRFGWGSLQALASLTEQGHKIQSPRTNISSSATSNTDNPISGPYGADCSHW